MGSGNGRSLNQRLADADNAIDARALGGIARDMSAKTFATAQVANLVHKLPKLQGSILTLRLIQAITEYGLSLFDELADPSPRLMMTDDKAQRTEETARFCLYVVHNLDAFLAYALGEKLNLFDAEAEMLAYAIIGYKAVAMPREMAAPTAESTVTDDPTRQG